VTTDRGDFEMSLGDRIEHERGQGINYQFKHDKKQVLDMNQHPYNAIGRLEMKFVVEGEYP
jgi:hypothetical protein